MLLSVIFSILRYGRDIPRAEDWLLVPALTGHTPSLAAWLWEQNDEHRLPVPRLAYLAILKMAGGDFRSGMVFNTLAMAALAAAMIYAAGRIRGRVVLADAVFPLAFLHLGHWHNLVWGWQIQFVLSVFLAGCVLLTIVLRGASLTAGWAVGAGVSCALLAMSGANGLVLVPPLALWLALAGLLPPDRSGGPTTRRTRRVVLGSAALAAAAVAAYFVGYQRAPWNPETPGTGATLRMGARFLALTFGPGAGQLWAVTVGIALGLLVATGALLAHRFRASQRPERVRVLGLLLFLVAVAALALAVGWGRSGRFPSGQLNSRYAILAVLYLCCTYFAWELYGPRRFRAQVRAALCLSMVALLPFNTLRGLADRDWVEKGMTAVERDISADLPRVLLAERHQRFLLHWDLQRLLSGLQMLRDAGLGPFAALREDAVREITLQWHDAAGTALGSRLVSLDTPRRVYGVRVRIPDTQESASQSLARIDWTAGEGGVRRMEEAPVVASAPGKDREATIWINEVIDNFGVRLDGPVSGRGASLTVLLSSIE